ncbi:FecR family protein [Dongia deserti]|uniref:FecR family protein n=1 Tax=Dongia deserti TaxID=2268030 RepID=UPI0013C51435|nr:FecR family protein [Dongia deserti]
MAILAAAAALGCVEAHSAMAKSPEIGAVIQRTYRGATAEGEEPMRSIYYRDNVFAQELIRTGTRGSTELEFLDNTHLVVGPNGEVRLDEFVYDPSSGTGGGQISLKLGAFRYQSGELKNKENVKLVTPTATMTIRGTHLVIFVAPDGATEVNVIEGAVDVLACNTPSVVAVTAGQRVNVTAGCATSVAGLRAMPRDYIPQQPGSTEPPIGDPGNDGPTEGPEPEQDQRG